MGLLALAVVVPGVAFAASDATDCAAASPPASGESPRYTLLAMPPPTSAEAASLLPAPAGWFDLPRRLSLFGIPVSTAIADLDGDGRLDLAVSASADDSLTLFLGPMGPDAEIRRGVPLGGQPFDVAAGDLDGDHRMDLVCSLWNDGEVAVLLNAGGASFPVVTRLAAGDQPRGVALADFDRDGDLDIAVTSFTANLVTVLTNHGDGTFAPGVSSVVGSGPMMLLAADVNADGAPDLVSADAGCFTVSCLVNHGDGTFAPRVTTRVPDTPYGIAAADLDGDGHLDLAMSGPNRAAVLWGDGNGGFIVAPSFAPAGTAESAGVAMLDVDGDGRLEVALVEAGTCYACFANPDLVRIWRNMGGRAFERGAGYRAIAGSQMFRVADLDGDGLVDLVTVADDPHANMISSASGVAILRARGDGLLAGIREQMPWNALGPDVTDPRIVAAVTLRIDGISDLAFGCAVSGVPVVGVSHNSGTDGFKPGTLVGRGTLLGVTDFDADGYDDLLIARGDTLEVRRGLPTRQFGPGVDAARGIFLAIGDFDGNGFPDLAVRDTLWNAWLVMGHGDGTFAPAVPSGVRLDAWPYGYLLGYLAFAALDLDRDGRDDLAMSYAVLPLSAATAVKPRDTRVRPTGTSVWTLNHLLVLRSRGDGGLDSLTDVLVPAPAGSSNIGMPLKLVPADFDGDGWKDLLALYFIGSNSYYASLLGRPDGTLLHVQSGSESDETKDVTTGDFDSDGMMDAIITSSNTETTGYLIFLRGHGGGAFDASSSLDFGDYTTSITSGRFDDDARLDIAWVNLRGGARVAFVFGARGPSGGPTPALATLVSASCAGDRTTLLWRTSGALGTPAIVLRSDDAGASWSERARLLPDGDGTVRFEDAGLAAGVRYGYRLAFGDGAARVIASETWLTVPASATLALAGATPNPVAGDLTVAFSLAERAPATLALFDLAGRRIVSREVGTLGAGSHRLRLAERAVLAPGLYFVRLATRERTLVRNAVVVR